MPTALPCGRRVVWPDQRVEGRDAAGLRLVHARGFGGSALRRSAAGPIASRMRETALSTGILQEAVQQLARQLLESHAFADAGTGRLKRTRPSVRGAGRAGQAWIFVGDGPLGTRQDARIGHDWVEEIGLDPTAYGTHSMRRTKPTLIYRRTKNLRAVQLLLGHTKLESTVRYLGIDVDDALEIAEQTEV